MSIEAYRKAKGRYNQLEQFRVACHQSNCDKFGATVKLSDTYIGYYGDSSAKTWADEVITAVSAQLTQSLKEAVDRAVSHAARELEKARQGAEAEAREILAETKESE